MEANVHDHIEFRAHLIQTAQNRNLLISHDHHFCLLPIHYFLESVSLAILRFGRVFSKDGVFASQLAGVHDLVNLGCTAANYQTERGSLGFSDAQVPDCVRSTEICFNGLQVVVVLFLR